MKKLTQKQIKFIQGLRANLEFSAKECSNLDISTELAVSLFSVSFRITEYLRAHNAEPCAEYVP